MEARIVKITFSATVDGETLAVEGATLSLGIDAVPSIELQCAPSTTESMAILKPNVEVPKISDFSDLYKKMSKKAAGLNVTGNVSIVVKDETQGRSDEISLNNWILSGVGLSSLSATAAPYMSVVLQHPICKLTKVGSIYETPKTRVDKAINKEVQGKTAFLDVMEAAYRAVRDKVDYYPVKQSAGKNIAVQYRNNLGVGEYDPKKYLFFKQGGTDIIFGNCVSGSAKARIAQAIGRFVVPCFGGSSTWDVLVSASGHVLLSVTQDETYNYTTDKLVLEPSQPWKTYSIVLNEDDCFSVELPGMDPYKLNGVMIEKLGPYNEPVDTGCMKNGNPNTENNMSVYMYNPVENMPKTDGRIMKAPVPTVLEAALGRDAEKGGTLTGATTKFSEDYKDVFNKAISKYAKAVYEQTAASQVSVRVDMALWFRDKNKKLILPGNTCKFASADGNEIFYGYISRVIHRLNALGGNETLVVMDHARSTADFMVSDMVAIPAGSQNPVYE